MQGSHKQDRVTQAVHSKMGQVALIESLQEDSRTGTKSLHHDFTVAGHRLS